MNYGTIEDAVNKLYFRGGEEIFGRTQRKKPTHSPKAKVSILGSKS